MLKPWPVPSGRLAVSEHPEGLRAAADQAGTVGPFYARWAAYPGLGVFGPWRGSLSTAAICTAQTTFQPHRGGFCNLKSSRRWAVVRKVSKFERFRLHASLAQALKLPHPWTALIKGSTLNKLACRALTGPRRRAQIRERVGITENGLPMSRVLLVMPHNDTMPGLYSHHPSAPPLHKHLYQVRQLHHKDCAVQGQSASACSVHRITVCSTTSYHLLDCIL